MTTNKLSRKVDNLLSACAKITDGSLGTTLRAGRASILLARPDGQLTHAGTYWERRSGQKLEPDGFDLQQTPVRVGNTETVLLRSGKRVITRTWDEAGGDYKFTKAGNAFYRNLRRNYAIEIPVRVTGARDDGTPYSYKSSMPIERLGLTKKTLPLNLTHAQRLAKIKAMVEDELRLGTLYEHSREKSTFDPDGAWSIHEETVATDPDAGRAGAQVVLDRGLGVLRSDLLFSDDICLEAYERREEKTCVPRQIAAVLKRDWRDMRGPVAD